MKFQTSTGLRIAWLTKYSGEAGFYGFSGRVRVVNDDPSQDEVVRWDSGYRPISHNLGSLQSVGGVANERVNGFNVFGGLSHDV